MSEPNDIETAIMGLLQIGKIRAARNADGSFVTRPDHAGRPSIAFRICEDNAPIDRARIDEEMEAYETEIASRASIAVPIPFSETPSGCIEWPVLYWATDADGGRLPVVPDDHGPDLKPIVWTGLYAVREEDGWWRFPDGERCDDKHLARAMRRRAGISIKGWEAQSREVAAMDRPWLATQH